jgi:hypothetical protein
MQAIRAAKAKVVALAGELGAKVGRPFSITKYPYDGGSQLFNSGNYQRSPSAVCRMSLNADSETGC